VATYPIDGRTAKELVDRARPAHAGVDVSPAVSTPGDPSFPSGHTMTAFAAAVVVGAFYPRLRWLLLGLATLVGLSRVYLGVHFLADVLAGAAAGVAIGLCAVWMARKTVRLVRRKLGVSLLRPVPVVSRRSSPSTGHHRTPGF
jgi:membrane-associated phospholipid phosphatase